MVKPETFARVASLKPLAPGRSAARETEPVAPVSDDDIKATALRLTETVADMMVFVMRYSAMRPGEVFQLRWRDVDRSGPVWIFRPAEWKTKRVARRRPRVVPLASSIREILEKKRRREKSNDEPIFSPRDAVRERCGSCRRRNVERYSETDNKDSFRTAIARAAKRAGVEPWGPNRLRRSAATEIRRLAGLDAAQVILSRANAKTTEIYAETYVDAAIEAAERVWSGRRRDSVADR